MNTLRARCGRILTATLVLAASAGIGTLGTAPSVSAAPGEGSISGIVLDENGAPLADVCVTVENVTGTLTDGAGAYSLTAIPEGSHRLVYSDCANPRTYRTQWYLGQPDQASAQFVGVFDGMDTPLADVTMQPGVSVTGRVVDQGGNGIPNVDVQVNPYDFQGPGAGSTTDANGDYRTDPLPDGNYRVRFDDGNDFYADQFWNGQITQNAADTLTLSVANGPVRPGVDATLQQAARITGRVTDTGGYPLQNICVNAHVPGNNGWDWVAGTGTDVNGDYNLGPLPPTSVHIEFTGCNQQSPYVGQWYQGVSAFQDSTPLQLSSGGTRSGIDATLATGSFVTGRVTDSLGNPIPGIWVNLERVDDQHRGGGSTDANGDYTTSAVPPGDYRVSFSDSSQPRVWANEWWNDKRTYDEATILTVDDPVETGIDAQLALGATVSGTVTRPDGAAAADICVGAAQATPTGYDGVGWSQTDGTGTYQLSGIPAGDTLVVFEDCNDTGPFTDQWYDDATGPDEAARLALASGEQRTGVDARMHPAAQISGRVTNVGGDPLEGICVQATTDTFVGGMDRTDSDGDYSLRLSRAGSYKIQFVDCAGGTHLGSWYGGGIEPSTVTPVPVQTGGSVTDIDAVLQPASSNGTVSGTVTNVRGDVMPGLCVVLYLPTDQVLFAQTDANGQFTFADVPTGTWTLGYLGCGSNDVSPIVPDIGGTGVTYWGRWWAGPFLEFTEGQGGPDPIAQGAKLITVHPDEAITADMCFGCGAIEVTSVKKADTSVTVAFDTPGIVPDGLQINTAAATQYTATCTSPTAATVSASGAGSPLTVVGFVAGSTYDCLVTQNSDGTLTADTAQFVVAFEGSAVPPAAPPSAGSPTAPGASTPESPTAGAPAATGDPGSDGSTGNPRPLAFTGGSVGMLVLVGGMTMLLGLLAVGRSRGRSSRRARA